MVGDELHAAMCVAAADVPDGAWMAAQHANAAVDGAEYLLVRHGGALKWVHITVQVVGETDVVTTNSPLQVRAAHGHTRTSEAIVTSLAIEPPPAQGALPQTVVHHVRHQLTRLLGSEW